MRWAAALLPWLCSVPACAEMPSFAEMDAAVQQLAPLARAEGLRLDLGALWHEALRQRSPLVAGWASDGRCLLGYTAYTPGRDYRWLFPDLPTATRAAWLRGAVAHELAHCVAQARAAAAARAPTGQAAGALADQPTAAADEEALADLAFAQQLGGDTTAIRELARLRHERGPQDPAHDSSHALLCWAERQATATAPAAGWFDALGAHLKHCGR